VFTTGREKKFDLGGTVKVFAGGRVGNRERGVVPRWAEWVSQEVLGVKSRVSWEKSVEGELGWGGEDSGGGGHG